MKPTQHPSNNRVLGAPAGWDQAQLPCAALAITDTDFAGMPAIWSFWRPDPVELAALNAGALVVLSILGRNMPPVAVMVEARPGGG